MYISIRFRMNNVHTKDHARHTIYQRCVQIEQRIFPRHHLSRHQNSSTILSFQNTTHVLMPHDPMVDIIASHFTSSYCHVRLGCTYDVTVQSTGRNVRRLKLSTRYTIPGNIKIEVNINFRCRAQKSFIRIPFFEIKELFLVPCYAYCSNDLG